MMQQHQVSPNFLAAFGLALATGLNASLPLLLIGILARTGLITLVPPFTALASTAALYGLTGLVLLEVLVDKVPVVDHLMHGLLFPLSVTAGAIVFGSQTHAIAHEDPGVQVVMSVLIGGGTAGIAHSTRAAIRPLTHVVLLGSLTSLAEDVTAASLTLSALYAPWMIPFIVLGLVGMLFVVCRTLYRIIRRKWGQFYRSLTGSPAPPPDDALQGAVSDGLAMVGSQQAVLPQPTLPEMLATVVQEIVTAIQALIGRIVPGRVTTTATNWTSRQGAAPRPEPTVVQEDELERERAAWRARQASGPPGA